MTLVLERYGTLSLNQVLAPAIRLAEEGVEVTVDLAAALKERATSLNRWESARRIFFKPCGGLFEQGDILVQKDLADTLRAIADQGAAGFYRGQTAQNIVQQMNRHGGLITAEDLSAFRALVRKPVHGTYRGYDVYSM